MSMLWEPKAWINSESVSLMTFEEQGIYRFLLDRAWINVGIPASTAQIQRMIRLGGSKFKEVWSLIEPNWDPPTDRMLEIWAEIENGWVPTPDRLWNPRQEEARLLAWRGIRDKQKRSAAAKAAAEARWDSERVAA